MKKKKRLRMAQRIFILMLCTMLVSGTCFNKYKIEARATTIVATLSAYTLYEICLYVGGLVIGCVGIGGLAYLIENRDDVARVGKDFIDSCDLDELSDWVISKADSFGQSYVFGSEALQTVKDTSFEVIQGGGGSPENNEDNDGDGDKDFDDRTKELEQMGMWGTATFVNWFAERIEDLLNKDAAGEETILSEYFEESEYTGKLEIDADGNYVAKVVSICDEGTYKYILTSTTSFRVACVRGVNDIKFYCNKEGTVRSYCPSYQGYRLDDGVWKLSFSGGGTMAGFLCESFSANIPIFSSLEACENYLLTGDDAECINLSEDYRIADWLKEDWQGVIESLNTGIRSLSGNMLIIGEALNQAIANQMNGLGYISAINDRIAGSVPLSLPGTVAAPLYYPDPSAHPALDPNSYPWVQSGDSPETDPEPEPGSDPAEDLNLQNYAVDLRQLFPFCIPFDLIALLDVLDAEPVAPRFEFPFKLASINVNEVYVIDLSMFDEQMAMLRKLELVGFIIGLMIMTGKVIKW